MLLFSNLDGVKLKIVELARQQPLDFWIKWIAAILALIHVYVTAHDVYPWYKFSGITTALLWLWLGYLWRQNVLVILNLIMVLIYLKGILGL
jgi:hypothetical protein